MFRFRNMGSRRERLSKEEKTCQVPNRYNPILISQIALTNQFPSHRYNKNRARKSSGPFDRGFSFATRVCTEVQNHPFYFEYFDTFRYGWGAQQGAPNHNAIITTPTRRVAVRKRSNP